MFDKERIMRIDFNHHGEAYCALYDKNLDQDDIELAFELYPLYTPNVLFLPKQQFELVFMQGKEN